MASQPKLLIRALVVICLLCLCNYASIHRHVSPLILSQAQLRHDNHGVPPLDKSKIDIGGNATSDYNSTKRWIDRNQSIGSDFRRLNVTQFPYKCGIVLFYHLPCTGGASINRWFRNRIATSNNLVYFTQWGRNHTARDGFARKMGEQLQKPLGPNEWRLSQAHGCSILPIEDEANLYKWREAVESQGCKFILTTVVRDPLSHTISQLKMKQYAEMKALKHEGNTINISMEEWLAQLGTSNRTAPRVWATQLDYFLFNCWDKNLDLSNEMTREEKVRKAMDILRKHFDLVIYQNHELFVEIITRMIEFVPISLRSSNEHKLEINFTNDEIGLMKRRVYENGDVDWINAIRHVYDAQLQYLVG